MKAKTKQKQNNNIPASFSPFGTMIDARLLFRPPFWVQPFMAVVLDVDSPAASSPLVFSQLDVMPVPKGYGLGAVQLPPHPLGLVVLCVCPSPAHIPCHSPGILCPSLL